MRDISDLSERLKGKTIIAPSGQVFTIMDCHRLSDQPGVRVLIYSDLMYPEAIKLADFLEKEATNDRQKDNKASADSSHDRKLDHLDP